MKIELTRLEKLAFAAVAILAAAVVALILFGCSSPTFDADAGTDAGDTDTQDTGTEDAGTDAGDDAGAEPDSGPGPDTDTGTESDAGNTCPFACALPELCDEIGGHAEPEHDCPQIEPVIGSICCHLEYWSDSGV